MNLNEWVNTETRKEIEDIEKKIPHKVMQHALELINEIDTEFNIMYRRRLVNILWKMCYARINSHCSTSPNYDACHEFCFYLEGWVWEVTYVEDSYGEAAHLTLTSLF